MHVGIVINHSNENMEAKFNEAASMGFKSCQFVSWNRNLWTDKEAEAVLNASKNSGVMISAVWCGWSGPTEWNFYEGQETLGLVPVAFRFQRMQDLMAGGDFALKLGIKNVVTHAGFLPENPHDPNYHGIVSAIRAVASHYARNGQNFLFETGQETPVTLLRTIEDVGTGNLGINLDPANLLMYGKANPCDALDIFGKYVMGVHAKDGEYPTDGRNLGDEKKLGDGRVNFPHLIAKLNKLGYKGPLTIEREIAGEQQRLDIMEGKEYLEEILSNNGCLD